MIPTSTSAFIFIFIFITVIDITSQKMGRVTVSGVRC